MFKRNIIALFSLIFVLGLSSNLFAQQSANTQYTIQPKSTVKVDGNSTLHKWDVKTSNVKGYFKIPSSLVQSAKAGQEFTEGKVTIPVKDVKSDEGGMTKKMDGALKMKKHPNISYNLTSAKVVSANGSTFTLDTKGNLTIKGNSQPIEMKVKGVVKNNGIINFSGSKDLKMTAFGVKPPTAFFGTIKASDGITVSFNLNVKESPATAMED